MKVVVGDKIFFYGSDPERIAEFFNKIIFAKLYESFNIP